MQKIINQIYLFLKRNYTVMAVLGVMTGLIHGDKLFSTNSGIDTEKIIYAGEDLYESWLGIGRQGLVLLKWMLGQLNFNPYFAGILTLVFLLSAVAAFGFVFEAVSGRQSRGALFLFGGVLIAHPILTEQMYFTLQGAEVTLAFNLTAASLYCAHRFACAECKKISLVINDTEGAVTGFRKRQRQWWIWFVTAVGLLIPTFGVYQAFVPLYIFGIIMLGCLRFVGIKRANGNQVRKEMMYAAKICVMFLTAFLINQIITRLFFSASDYLSKQIMWDFSQSLEGVKRILAHIRDVVLGNGIFYFGTFAFLALVLTFAVYIMGRRKVREKLWTTAVPLWGMVLLAGVFASPFFLTILMGERPVIRGQLVLPFVMAFMTYMSYMVLAEDRIRKIRDVKIETNARKRGRHGFESVKVRLKEILLLPVVVISLLTIWLEADITCRLYYTDAVRYQEDLQLAGWLEHDIAVFTNDCNYDGTVVFVGKRNANGNCASIKGDVMGQSLFAWDTDVEPVNFWSSSRIVGFMHCQGVNYKAPDAEQVKIATIAGRQMKCYPANGSIMWCKDAVGEDMVVVKLSTE